MAGRIRGLEGRSSWTAGSRKTSSGTQACYTAGDKNIVIMHGFKEYCALLFTKGALLKDASGILIQQTENVQAARQIRFTGVGEIAGAGTRLEGLYPGSR